MTLEANIEETWSDQTAVAVGRADCHRQPRPILIVLHQERSTPGHIGQALERLGHVLDIRKPRFGDPLPSTLADHDGAIIFGGPMSANDNTRFIRTETHWINVALKEGKPYLGVCLGAQMLACCLGARVYRDAYARAEIGYHPIRPHAPTVNGVAWPDRVYQWHRDGFDLPSGAKLLASADGAYPHQAFQYGTAIALQFHPEIMYTQVNRWSSGSRHRMMLPGAQRRAEQLSDHLTFAPSVLRWLDAYLQNWIATGLTSP
ncbi:MAG: glutamine amidotransferase-related protein [Hyphomicrobiaceae bacterium]